MTYKPMLRKIPFFLLLLFVLVECNLPKVKKLKGILEENSIFVYKPVSKSPSPSMPDSKTMPSAQITGNTYYVSSSVGNDNWTGLSQSPGYPNGPKKTLLAVRNLIISAKPGDGILLKSGDTWTGSSNQIFLGTGGGSRDKYVLVSSYGGEVKPKLQLNGVGSILGFRGSKLKPPEFIVFENLHLTTSGSPGNRPIGILISESINPNLPHHITFKSIEISGLTYGITVTGNGPYAGLHFENMNVHDNYKQGSEKGHSAGAYIAKSDGLVMKNNIFKNNGKPTSWFDWNVYLSATKNALIEGNQFSESLSGIKIRSGDGIIVRENRFKDHGCVCLSVGSDTTSSMNNVLIEKNLCSNMTDGFTIRGQSGGSQSSNIIVRNNILHSNQAPPKNSPCTGESGIIRIGGQKESMHNIKILNNTIANVNRPSMRAIAIEPSGKFSGAQIKNNIFQRHTSGYLFRGVSEYGFMKSINMDNNLFDCHGSCTGIFIISNSVYTNINSFRKVYNKNSTNSIEADSLFTNPSIGIFSLSFGSPAIDAGIDLKGLVDDDITGNSRPKAGGWDIGAYEN